MYWIKDQDGRLVNLDHATELYVLEGDVYAETDGAEYLVFSGTPSEAQAYLDALWQKLEALQEPLVVNQLSPFKLCGKDPHV